MDGKGQGKKNGLPENGQPINHCVLQIQQEDT